MGSIQIPFDIGEQVWWVGRGYHEEWITCPECNGDKVLTLIQGNGTKVSIACAGCSAGYDPPRGVIQKSFYHYEPTSFTCREVSMHGSNEFWYCDLDIQNIDSTTNLFRTKEECEKKCGELNIEKAKDEERRLLNNTQSKRRDMAWSVHYWGRKVGELKKELEFAERRLSVCKEKKESK